MASRLPIPSHYAPAAAGEVWRVPYEDRAREARAWAAAQQVAPAAVDSLRLALVVVDAQNTFCIPGFELYVTGRSGNGAVDDSRRLAEFIYRELGSISQVVATMDTHQAIQIFHAICLIDSYGNHPAPFTRVTVEEVERGVWRFNPAVAAGLGISPEYGQRHLRHYVASLRERAKYDLTVWPYHSMLGGVGHALVSIIAEAIFFHGIARVSQPDIRLKGNMPLTEHYSVLGPEVMIDAVGARIGAKDQALIDKLLTFDAVAIAGQAKSHCVAWTVEDLLHAIRQRDATLANRIYLLEDCTSAVVVPGVIDYTDDADRAFHRFEEAGMHIVRSTDPVEKWPGITKASPAGRFGDRRKRVRTTEGFNRSQQ